MSGFWLASTLVTPAVIGLRLYLNRRYRLARLEAWFRALRRMHDVSPRYRLLVNDDDSLFPRLSELAAITAIGNVIDDNTGLVTRWFIDADETTLGLIASAQGRSVVAMMSFAGTRVVMTRERAHPTLESAPWVMRQFVPMRTNLAEMLAAHRTLGHDVPVERLAPAFDQISARLVASTEAARAWREAQPVDALLDADLHAFLRENYARFGPALAERLREIPHARVVR